MTPLALALALIGSEGNDAARIAWHAVQPHLSQHAGAVEAVEPLLVRHTMNDDGDDVAWAHVPILVGIPESGAPRCVVTLDVAWTDGAIWIRTVAAAGNCESEQWARPGWWLELDA